jgi:hypothetical protein
LVRGELLAASFRKRIKVKMDEENAVMQKELEEQRVKAALKKQLSKKMKVATAINEDDGAVLEAGDPSQSLLGADADDETKLSERV